MVIRNQVRIVRIKNDIYLIGKESIIKKKHILFICINIFTQ